MRLCSSVADPHSFFAVPDPGNHELGQLRRAKYQYKGVLSYYSYLYGSKGKLNADPDRNTAS
jgi:hypothetical protein